jgi:hypothetical protein
MTEFSKSKIKKPALKRAFLMDSLFMTAFNPDR